MGAQRAGTLLVDLVGDLGRRAAAQQAVDPARELRADVRRLEIVARPTLTEAEQAAIRREQRNRGVALDAHAVDELARVGHDAPLEPELLHERARDGGLV